MAQVRKTDELVGQIVSAYSRLGSVKETAAEFGLHEVTVSKWLKAEGVEIPRWRQKEPARWEDRTCPQCGTVFSIQKSQKKTYCSRVCSGKAARLRIEEHACEGCGRPIPPPSSGKTRYTYRKYCSMKCRVEHGKFRQKDPDNWVSFECQTCGKTTERRKSVPGPRKFCSNECATKHTKTVKHYAVRESDMVLDSTWEALFVGQCGWFKVECRRFDREGVIEWRPGQWYGPDFVLPELGVTVEIKGVEDPDDRAKWDAFREKVGPLAVIDKVVLQEIRMIDTREGFVEIVTRVSGS